MLLKVRGRCGLTSTYQWVRVEARLPIPFHGACSWPPQFRAKMIFEQTKWNPTLVPSVFS